MCELMFWYNIMRELVPIVFSCGFIISILSWVTAYVIWILDDKISKTFLLMPLVIAVLGLCYYIGMERLAFNLTNGGPC